MSENQNCCFKMISLRNSSYLTVALSSFDETIKNIKVFHTSVSSPRGYKGRSILTSYLLIGGVPLSVSLDEGSTPNERFICSLIKERLIILVSLAKKRPSEMITLI